MRYQFDVEGDHFQILIGDRVRGPLVDTTELWESGGRIAAMLNAPELIGLGTARYGGKTRILVELELPPHGLVTPGWTPMGEFLLHIPSGEILLWGPEAADLGNMSTVRLEPGMYHGRAFSRGTDAVLDEMASEGPDEYRIVLWRSI